MMKRISISLLCLGVLLFGLATMLHAKEPQGGDSNKGHLSKVATNNVYRLMLINNITNYYSNNGDGSFNPFSVDNEGYEFPKGSNQFVIFEDGLVWGGFQKRWDETAATLKIGGSTYNHGIQAGPIITPGTATTAPVAASAGDASYRAYRVRPDITPTTPQADALLLIQKTELPYITRWEQYTAQQILDQYVKDWNEWPAAQGAPYTDVNHNGKYDSGVDIPGVPGADQTIWYVANDMDLSLATHMYGSNPIGIEYQKTIWAYNRSGVLGNSIFERNLVINKSGARIDSMFFTKWSDPDLGGSGSAGYNAAGCDSLLGLGFVYMGVQPDPTYGNDAPAGGFDFLQGPVIAGLPSDSALFQGRIIHGKKNLKMTGFNFFINGGGVYNDPPLGTSFTGTIQFYNLMNALVPSTGAPFVDPISGRITPFLLTGDPTSQSGWLFSQIHPPADVRICLTTGPFSMAPADSQEVVVGVLASLGADRLSSVAKLKFDDRQIKAAYAFNFDLPSPPPAPVVTSTVMDGTVVLDWSNPTTAAATESYTKKGYNFEGYNVYQLSGASFSNPVLLATYDVKDGIGSIQDLTYDNATGTNLVKTVQFGTDSGVQRYYSTTQDKVKSTTLINGNPYYYAVTAYSVNLAAQQGSLTLESPPAVFQVVPQVPFGTQIRAAAGDTIGAAHTSGVSTGTATVSVINPAAITGDVYQIQAVKGSPLQMILSTGDTLNTYNMQYQLVDVTKGNTVVVSPKANFGIDHTNPTFAGLQYGLNANPHYVEGSEVASYSYPSGWRAVNQLAPYVAGSGFFPGSLKPYQVTKSIEVDFLGTPKSGAKGQNAYDYKRTATSGSGGSGYIGYFPQPFTVWDITTTPKRQIDCAFLEAEAQTPSTFDSVWAPGTVSGNREYVWFIDQDYTPTAKPIYSGAANTVNGLANVPVLYAMWVYGPATGSAYKAGDKIVINVSVALGADDKWTFTTDGRQPITSTDLAKQSVQNINVWPNPYFGFNKNELNKYQRFVQISHLPSKATIRIFNLAGILIRTIIKNDATQFATWDLQNQSGLPVAAGMYIMFIDMPDLGTSKTLKLAVIPETQFLDRY